MRSLADVMQSLAVRPDVGLAETQVQASRQQFGDNALTPIPREPIWLKFIEKFDEPIIKILIAAALLSMIVDIFKFDPVASGVCFGALMAIVVLAYLLGLNRWTPILMFASAIVVFGVGLASAHFLVEGLAVMVAVILATGVAFASEYKSDREFDVLNAQKESLRCKVRRDGKVHSMPSEEIVVGDIVLLETGDEIPADGRLLQSNELLIDQSLMTGESEPAAKSVQQHDDTTHGPEQPGCLYRGTQVVDGTAQMLVIEVGDRTDLGKIAHSLAAQEVERPDETTESRIKRKLTISKELTPLQQKLAVLAGLISQVGYIAAALIFVALLFHGMRTGQVFWPTTSAEFAQILSELLGYFMTMVIIIVVAVPEGLPMSVTISLALAMQKMTRANSLVRQLVACETIGSATVICTDKTGTMTQNLMRVDRVCLAESTIDSGEAAFLPAVAEEPFSGGPSAWMAIISAVNSTAHLDEKEGRLITVGNSTEGALLHWLRDAGIDYAPLRKRHPLLHQIHFTSENKRMTSVVAGPNQCVALVKGATEWLLASCASYLDADGRVQPLTPAIRQAVAEQLHAAATKAMRTLAFAYAPLPGDAGSDPKTLHALCNSLEGELVYVGFVAIRDPLRDDVKGAIAECRSAGIDVKMVTGDNPETARAIAFEAGLIQSPDEPIDADGSAIMTTTRFNSLSDDELKQQLPRLRVLARARPLDKFRLVRLLQELGEVVAVTGDGTNDAPALKKADVGLAMGIAGTEVAKEASKIVLLDDAFSTIVNAVHWGRSLYENIQRFLQFQLTINVSALAITFLGILFFNVKAPFTVLQLLWINVIMDTLASIALCSEPPRPGVMNAPPKKRSDNILTAPMLATILTTACFFVVVMLSLLIAMSRGFLTGDGPIVEGFTMRQATLFFSIYVFFQVWNQINARSLTPDTSGLDGILANPTFLLIAGVVALGQIAIVTFGGSVFHVEPLGVLEWLGVIGFTASVLVFSEIARWIRTKT